MPVKSNYGAVLCKSTSPQHFGTFLKRKSCCTEEKTPLATKHQPHGNCEYLPLFLLVYERVMKATKNMRAQCWNMCSVDYKGCFLPISYSSDGAWNCDKGWKRPWKGSQKLKHDSYLFFAGLSGSDLTSLPGRVLFANKFLVLHASAMVWYVYLTCSVLWNEKYVPTENKTKK